MFWCKSLTDIQRQKNIDIYFCGLGFQALCFFSQFYLAGVRLINIYIKIISHWKSKNSGGGAGRMYLGSPTINHCIYCCTVLLCSSTSFGETTIQVLCLIFNWVVCFLFLSFENSFHVMKANFYHTCVLKIFPPSQWLVFS